MSIASQTQAMQLADQINDEFLTCKICYEHYKEPKSLSCLHTFCEECIEQHVGAQRSYKYTDYREFSCPICRKKTVIPSGGCRKLTDNFLISNLNELMQTKKPSKIPYCDICKIVSQCDRDATSKCLECQKHMCLACVQFHAKTKITAHHSIFELDIEKDIMCKEHPNEQVRFYCETCEVCVCVPCTYTEHAEHDLVDFADGIKHHKDTIEANLWRCRQRIDDLRERTDSLRSCESRILHAQNEIHSIALNFVETIRVREKSLVEELDEYYGYETKEYLKKKEDFDTFLDQLTSTCNLTEMVVKGKDIEMLLLKKQLCEKFSDFDLVQIDPVPKNISKKVVFVPGCVDLGKLANPDDQKHSPSASTSFQPSSNSTSAGIKGTSSDNSDEKNFYNAKETSNDDEDNNEDSDNNNLVEDTIDYDYGSEKRKKKKLKKKNSDCTIEKCTQMTSRDVRDLQINLIESTESQTDIRMCHELQAPNPFLSQRDQPPQRSTLASRTASKEIQTDADLVSSPLSESGRSLSNQSSLDEDSSASSAPVDRNKLGRRVRRHVKPGCSIAVLPSSEIIIIDPESNCISILDRRGRFKYGMSNSNKPCTENGHPANSAQFGTAAFGHLPRLDRGVRLLTPQGTLIVKLINESSSTTVSPTPSQPGSSVIGSIESTPVSNTSASQTPVSSRPNSVSALNTESEQNQKENSVGVTMAPIANNEETPDDEDAE